jgi:hypothetical protein
MTSLKIRVGERRNWDATFSTAVKGFGDRTRYGTDRVEAYIEILFVSPFRLCNVRDRWVGRSEKYFIFFTNNYKLSDKKYHCIVFTFLDVRCLITLKIIRYIH